MKPWIIWLWLALLPCIGDPGGAPFGTPFVIDPDRGLPGLAFGIPEASFIRELGPPDAMLRLPDEETWMLYGRGIAFLFQSGRFEGVRLMGAVPDQAPAWSLDKGIVPGMNPEEIRFILGDRLVARSHYQHEYRTARATVRLLFSESDAPGGDRCRLSGAVILWHGE